LFMRAFYAANCTIWARRHVPFLLKKDEGVATNGGLDRA
jgi:hypothetical protein